jgi:hypothetical protein
VSGACASACAAVSLGAAVAVLAGCRFGGPSADPEAYLTFPSDASADAAGTDATTEASTPVDDAMTEDATASDADEAEAEEGDGAADAPGTRPANDACGRTVAVCDPVENTGCNPFQQCDVDSTQTVTPTGVCVFNNGPTDGGPCTSSVFSETCPPHFTCSAAECRPLCACDADCPAGQCCSDATGPAGFLLCQACP